MWAQNRSVLIGINLLGNRSAAAHRLAAGLVASAVGVWNRDSNPGGVIEGRAVPNNSLPVSRNGWTLPWGSRRVCLVVNPIV